MAKTGELFQMVRVTIVIRKLGRTEIEYSLPLSLSEIPQVGHYISLFRSDNRERSRDDLIVRHVWWHIDHPTPADGGSDSDLVKEGREREILVECDHAYGPYLVEKHRRFMEQEAIEKGVPIESFGVSRVVIPTDETK
jgi:hypothetical protein